MKLLYKTLVLLPLMVVSCTDLITYEQMGTQPTPPSQVAPVLSLRAEQAPHNVISMTFTKGDDITSITRNIFIHSTSPVDKQCTIALKVDDEQSVKIYSEQKGKDYTLLPTAFYKLENGKYLELNPGETESIAKKLTIYSKNLLSNILETGYYLLPLVGESDDNKMNDNKIYIDITVREKYKDPDGVKVYEGSDMFTVLYINTSSFDPRLSTDMVLIHELKADYKRGLGNIVNLRTASIYFDNRIDKVSVKPSNDLKYILEHKTKRVLPVQESGRKVCICIEGGGNGLGFCNLTDKQITEFVVSVKRLVDTYGLDGVNLWDRNSNYEKSEQNGFSKMNTTSYPKLIIALRKALGKDKLLTIVDYEKPTEYFFDTIATKGIEVGKYIDYAWSGYCEENEPVQIVDPWHPNSSIISSHKRKPIAGLDSQKYGCVNATIYADRNMAKETLLTEWTTKKYNSNNIMVFYDVRSNIQDKYEGAYWNPLYIIQAWYNDAFLNMNLRRLDNTYTEENPTRYNKWGKDW